MKLQNTTIIQQLEDVFPYIENNNAINFLSVAISPWHALGIDAMLSYLKDKGKSIHAIIIIMEHPTAGFLIDESCFTNRNSTFLKLPQKVRTEESVNVRLIKNNEYKETSILLKFKEFVHFYTKHLFEDLLSSSNKQDFYYSDPNYTLPHIVSGLRAKGKHVIFGLTEEGYAGYMNQFLPEFCHRKFVKDFNSLRIYIRNYIFGYRFYHLIHPFHTARMFVKTPFGLKINKPIIPYFRDAFNLRNHQNGTNFDKAFILNAVIVCTPFWGRDIISDNEDYRVLKNVCTYLTEKGATLILKTHPRDTFYAKRGSELGCIPFDTKGLSIEAICAYQRPLAVIGFSSTALVNTKVFWNIPTYCLTDLIDNSKLSVFLKKEINSFKSMFHRHICFVKKISEIKI